MIRTATCAIAATFLLTGLPALADDTPSAEAVGKINSLLAEMTCEVDEDNIEMEDGSYDLDDVQCADGQYDIMLDKNFEVTGKRKE